MRALFFVPLWAGARVAVWRWPNSVGGFAHPVPGRGARSLAGEGYCPLPFALVLEGLDADVLVHDRGLGVVGLEGEGRAGADDAAGVALRSLPVFGLGPIADLLAVHEDLHVLALDDDVFGEPLVILEGFFVVLHVVDAAGFLPVAVGVVDLDFKTFVGPVGFLVGGVEVDAAIGDGLGHAIDLKFKVLEGRRFAFEGTGEVEVRALAIGNDGAVLDLPGIFVFLGLGPAGEVLPVEESLEALFRFVGGKQCPSR